MPPLRTTLFALGLVSTVASCGLLTGPSDRDRLEAAEARWARSSLKAGYTFEVSRSCECIFPDALSQVEVTVLNGTITRASMHATGEQITGTALGAVPTVEDLFTLIRTAIATGAAEVRVTYDRDFGAPLDIWIDRDRTAVDEELAITAGNFHALTVVALTPPIQR